MKILHWSLGQILAYTDNRIVQLLHYHLRIMQHLPNDHLLPEDPLLLDQEAKQVHQFHHLRRLGEMIRFLEVLLTLAEDLLTSLSLILLMNR